MEIEPYKRSFRPSMSTHTMETLRQFYIHIVDCFITNGRDSDGTGKCKQGGSGGGTCETQGGVAGCGCSYGVPCGGGRQVHSTQTKGEYGSYFRAGSPLPERTVVTGSS